MSKHKVFFLFSIVFTVSTLGCQADNVTEHRYLAVDLTSYPYQDLLNRSRLYIAAVGSRVQCAGLCSRHTDCLSHVETAEHR